MVKKCFLVVIALIAMETAANATDFTGTVYNIHMGSKEPNPVTGITFSLDNNILTGDFDVPVFPLHHIDLIAEVNKACPNASGTVTVYGIELTFTGCVTLVKTPSGINFHFEGQTDETVINVSFDFEGTPVS
jgi:hypothetical protein